MTNSWAALRPRAAVGDLWKIEGDRAVPTGRSIVGPTTLLVPSEDVLLLPVDLPLPTPRRRREALPFAIEERLIDPIEIVHIALGVEIAPRRYLAGVVRHEVIRRWIGMAEAAGVGHAACLPDALSLPTPQAGTWSIEIAGARALVRTDDGAGFAVAADRVEPLRDMAGRPARAMIDHDPAASLPIATVALDLRQGAYARRSVTAGQPLVRKIAWIAGAGLAAHGAIAMADTLALRSIADERRSQAEALIAIASPGRYIGADADLEELADELFPGGGAERPSRFLAVLARSSAALSPMGQAITLESIRYGGSTLMLDIAGDPGARAQAAQALRRAGFSVSLRPAGDGVTGLSVEEGR